MGRLTWGTILALFVLAGLVPAVHAAEIPPTKSCETTFKRMLDDYYVVYNSGLTKKERKALDKQLAIDLETAGCISDAEPLYTPMPAKPFSAKCETAAAEAGRYWGSLTRKIQDLTRPFIRKVQIPHDRKVKKLKKRIRTLKANGKKARAAALQRKKKRINRVYRKQARVLSGKIRPVLFGTSYNTMLITTEFVSLRCISSEFSEDMPRNSPVAKVVEKNFVYVFSALFVLLEKYDDSDSGNRSLQGGSTDLPFIDLRR